MAKAIINALPELVNKGLISPGQSEEIKNYYQQQQLHQPNRLNIIFGVIGAILVGLGIILILAHNWDELSRPVKLIFSFAPLVLGQVLCGFTLLKKMDNRTWKESCATFLFFAIGASIALVAQVYHIPGNLGSFMFTWMLLSFPIVYIMPSSMVSLLYLAGITWYAVEVGYGYKQIDTYAYWWLILLSLPHYILLIKNKPQSNFTLFHHWFYPLSLTICLGTLSVDQEEFMFLAYMNLFAAFYILGNTQWLSFKNIRSNGYLLLGSLGTMIILLMLSFNWFWNDLLKNGNGIRFSEILAISVTGLAALFLLFLHFQEKKAKVVNLMLFIFIFFSLAFFIGMTGEIVGALLMNLLVLAAAIFTIQRGVKLDHLGVVNYGLLIITALVLCRFFDTNISFVIRGLLFIGVGCGFFFANNQLLKRRKLHAQ